MSNINILFNQPKRENDLYAAEIGEAIDRVLQSGIYILGDHVRAFEQEFSEYCQTRHCCAVANGTDALEIALRALQIEPEDEVITVPNAGGYSTTACNLVGAVPVYVDVDPGNLLMNLDQLPAAVSSRTKCVIATHLYGQTVDIRQLRSTLDAAGFEHVAILEDCAQAHGASIHGGRAGSLGDIATFSFYPTKNLGALGDGGAITTSDDELAVTCRCLRQYGWTAKYQSQVSDGRNSRLDELQAAILRVKLKHLDELNARRDSICQQLADLGRAYVKVVTESGDGNVGHLFVVRHPERDQIRETLKQHGIATDIHFPILDPDQQSLSSKTYRAVDLHQARQATGEIFSLPCYAGITDQELDYMRQVFEKHISVIVEE